MSAGRVVLVANDLVVAGRASGALRSAGFTVQRRSPQDLEGAAEGPGDAGEAPAFVVVDLDARGLEPVKVAEWARRRWPGVRVVGIVQHVHRDRIARARAADFHRIVPRSRLAELGSALAG